MSIATPATIELNEQDIIEFLQSDPDFFARNPQLTNSLPVAHSVHGTTSLVNIRLQQQRLRIDELETQLSDLMNIAMDNEKLFRIYADIYTALYSCKSVAQMQRILMTELQAQLPLAAVNLYINEAYFQIKPQHAHLAISAGKLIQVSQLKFAGSDHYLGSIAGLEKLQLFGSNTLVSSVALMALGDRGQYGLLAIGSAKANHYQEGMDNLLLAQLCRIISTLLPQLIPTRDQVNTR